MSGRETDALPPHLKHWPGLWVRQGDEIVPACQQDIDTARSYPAWRDKGPLVRGRRLTIMAASLCCDVGSPLHVIHVFEVIEPGGDVRVMGPKPVLGEYLDDRLATGPAGPGDEALRPRAYDGRTLASPAVDYNFEITRYVFVEPGMHRIVWKVDDLTSNALVIEVQQKFSAAGSTPDTGRSGDKP
jgi:hypothetical protein